MDPKWLSRTRAAWLAAAVALWLASLGTAQITLSTIRGTVKDPAGAVIVGAEVKAVNLETNVARTVTTNQNGDYEIADLPRGPYRVSASSAGFKTFVAQDVMLRTGEVRRIDMTLELGAVATEVTVSAGAAVISTENAKIEGAVNTQYHADTPWVGAEANLDPTVFLTTLPLIQSRGGVWSASFAGQNSTQAQMGQDGHTNDREVNQINDIFDAQEIIAVPTNNSAEFARAGYMNMVTKSGSNQFHGRLAYWNLNDALKAREFFESEKARTRIHTISIQASGPVLRNRTFFYGSGNFLIIPSEQFYLQDVPTAKMRQGDFSQLLNLARPLTVRDPLSGVPFPGNVIPAARISSVARKVTDQYLPAPNRGGPDDLGRNYGFTFPFPTDYRKRQDFTQRIDHNFSDKNQLMVRFIENWGFYVLPTSFPQFSWTRVRFNVHTVVQNTHVFSPTLVNTARVGFYKEKVTDGEEVYGVKPFKGDEAVSTIGLQGVNPQKLSAQGFPRMNFSNYPALYTQPGGMRLNDHNWGFADTVTWSKGRHVIKFGGEYKPQSRFDNQVKEPTYGRFTFNGSFSGYDYADFLLGIPYQSERLDQLTGRTLLDKELGLFVTDDFKVSSKLTLNLGLRWDWFAGGSYEDGLMWNWDIATGNIVVDEKVRAKVRPLYDPRIPIATGQVTQNPKLTNFAPRLGAAYRLNDTTVLRGGYGIYTETLGRYARALTGGPFEITETYINWIADGQPLFTFPNPFPGDLGQARIPSQSFTGYPLDTDNGKIHQFNVSLERQVKDVGFRISYVGARNRGMNYSLAINKPQPSLIPFTQARRPWPLFVGGSYFRSDGEQNYNALSIQAQRRMGQVTFDAHWTLTSNYYTTDPRSLENPYVKPGFSRVPFTSRQRAVFNVVWEMPFGRGRRYLTSAPALVHGILGGWRLYWIGYLESGFFFSPTFSGSDPSNTNTFGGLPDRIANGNLPPDQRQIDRWFDAAAFRVPQPGTFGNSGANVLEGPGYNMQHVSIAKSFDLTERLKFTFTAALSNAFNHPNFTVPRANISSPGTVGTINDLREGARARNIELRGRIDW